MSDNEMRNGNDNQCPSGAGIPQVRETSWIQDAIGHGNIATQRKVPTSSLAELGSLSQSCRTRSIS